MVLSREAENAAYVRSSRNCSVTALVAALFVGNAALAEAQNQPAAIAVKWYEAFDENRPDILEAILSSNWQELPSEPEVARGAQSATSGLKMLHTTFPDFRIAIDDIVTDGNKVVVRSTITGTQMQPFAGLAASGRKIRIQAIDIHLVEDGKITKTWHSEDWMTGLRQLGAFER
ncbi:ester cyclase [Rhizobium sp. P44RR-XXIV]|nr:ester cyclase [Rhizobium sp. P44RR-XXIV]